MTMKVIDDKTFLTSPHLLLPPGNRCSEKLTSRENMHWLLILLILS